VHDKSSDVLWTRHFLEAQGYPISYYIIYQDKMSTFSLAKNGRISSSKRTKHINVKCFFVKHYFDSAEINFCFCPTEQMWANILTKPLQGVKFCQMCAFLMKCPTDYSEDPPFIAPITIESPSIIPIKPRIKLIMPSLQECVGGLSSSSKPAKAKHDRKDLLTPHRSSQKKKISWLDQPPCPSCATSTRAHHKLRRRLIPVSESNRSLIIQLLSRLSTLIGYSNTVGLQNGFSDGGPYDT
jgi:hypothetical protein